MSEPGWTFSEKNFYLAEFRGRSLAVALPAAGASSLDPLEDVIDELAANGTRTLLMVPARSLLQGITRLHVVRPDEPDWLARLWRAHREGARVALELGSDDFAGACRDVARRLRLAKLVWLDPRGALRSRDQTRLSVIDVSDLDALLAAPPSGLSELDCALLREIRGMLEDGLPAINFCSLEGLSDDLFTYAGSGTFFTRERYAEVRRLGLDELDAAADLIARGVDEGYLAPREDSEIDTLLGHGFGVFVEGRYLAGIGALLPHAKERAGEVAGLYTLTRFLGEGVGGQLLRFALECAAEAGYEKIFACTTSERVERFFLRNGYARVTPESLPPSKWAGYPEARRARLICLARAV